MINKPDTDKTQWSLLPFRELEEIARAFMAGNRKYSPDSWKSVSDKRKKYFDAAMRHLTAWHNGSELDESGCHPLAHAAACILILLWDKNNGGE